MSLKQIAQMVGTSPSTVSRVLNQKSPSCASKELQEKIWEAARQIAYLPNEAARTLKAGRGAEEERLSLRICVLFARGRQLRADPFFTDLLCCVQEQLFAQQMLLDGVFYGEDDTDWAALAEADGVILLGRCSDDLLERVKKKNQNVVGIRRNPMNYQVDEVICDGKEAAVRAVSYLFSLGHRQIAYIGDCSFENRYVGYTSALIDHGIPINYRLIRETDQTYETGQQAMQALLEESADFTAVFCANDITALAAERVLLEQKNKTGRRISLISIDDIEECLHTQPRLTTIHIPREEMAHMAVSLLADRIRRGHREIVRIAFPCRLIKRGSCFAP